MKGFPGGPVLKNLPCNAKDTGQSLFQEDPTCHRATKPRATTTKPVLYSLRATTTEPIFCNY